MCEYVCATPSSNLDPSHTAGLILAHPGTGSSCLEGLPSVPLALSVGEGRQAEVLTESSFIAICLLGPQCPFLISEVH